MIKRISQVLKGIEVFTLVVSILLMAIFNIANVIGRTFFNKSLTYTEEVSQFLIIAITFIGLAYAAREGRHIRMSAIYDQLNLKWRKIFMLSITFITGSILLALTKWSLSYVVIVYKLNVVSPSLQIPLYFVYMLCPLGLFMGAAQYYLAFIQNLRKKEVYISVSEKEHREQAL